MNVLGPPRRHPSHSAENRGPSEHAHLVNEPPKRTSLLQGPKRSRYSSVTSRDRSSGIECFRGEDMAAGAGAAAAAIAEATKASGVLVRLGPDEFVKLLTRVKDPLIVIAEGGIFRKNFQYLVSYKGLAFFTKSFSPLALPSGAEVVSAGRIWIPG